MAKVGEVITVVGPEWFPFRLQMVVVRINKNQHKEVDTVCRLVEYHGRKRHHLEINEKTKTAEMFVTGATIGYGIIPVTID